MAILNSITIGKGRKSLGNVTLQTLGGVTVAKQKITKNTSNTSKQKRQRSEFSRIMNVLRKFAPLARAAYSRVKTQSAFSRFAKMLYVPASEQARADLPTADPMTLVQAIVTGGDDAIMVDGSKVFSAVTKQQNYTMFSLATELPGAKPFDVGDVVPVDVVACVNAKGKLTTSHFNIEVTEGTIDTSDLPVLNLTGGVLTLVLDPFAATGYPVISINNERIGLHAQTYLGS